MTDAHTPGRPDGDDKHRRGDSPTPGMQRSRANQSVDEDTLATYTAAKGFLIAENLGALLMVYSFTHLYVFGLRPGGSGAAVVAGVVLLVIGGLMYWRSRDYYLRLDFPWQRKWEIVATLLAASAAVFWLLFALASFLVWRGVELL